MLVLTRRETETVRLYTSTGEVVEVIVLRTKQGSVRLGFIAADGTRIVRSELETRKDAA